MRLGRWVFIFCLLFIIHVGYAHAEAVSGKPSEKRILDLTQKQKALEKQEERLKALKKDVDEKIEEYTKLLNRIETALNELKAVKEEHMKHLIKTYEAMPEEEAAARLSVLYEPTAVDILLGMNSRKAGAIMGLMEPKKAASITKRMTEAAKKIPIK